MRIIKLILFTITLALACSISYGQAPTKVAFGGTRPIDTAWAGRHLRIDSTVRFLKYSTSDATKYLRINASGFLELGTPAGGGGNADSAIFFTNYRADTMRSNIYTQLGLKGTGTVTNVSTGFGMLGGPITTAGTVRVDSNAVMTVARGYKVSDSVAGLIPSLTGYATTTALADSVSGRVKYSDTSTVIGTRSWVTTNYVPYTGATDSVRLGEYPIRAGQFRFDLTPTISTVVGGMYWDATNNTISVPLTTDVNLQIGQESLVRARNNTGSTVTNGQVVYIAGAQGNNPTIGLADADSASTSQVIGVATEDIADNGTGFVTVSGVVNGVNTSSWNAGDKLYLSTTNGQLTNTPPTPPHISVMVGTALNSTNNGQIFVSPSQPIATDTNLLNGTTVPPTQYAVKSYVQSQGYGTGTIKALTGDVTASGTGTVTATLATVNASPATYTNATVTVDSKGRVTLASSGTAPVTSVSGTSGRISSTGGTTPVLDLVTVNATPATYGGASAIPVVTVDAYGRATTITTVSPAASGTVTSIQVVGGTGATVTPTTAVTTSGVYTVTPEVSSATYNTLSNKRWIPRVISAASYTTSVTIPADSVDLFQITAQAGALLFNAPSGTPNNGELLVIRIKDNGTARALTYNAIFNWSPPSTTVLGKYLVMCFMYNSVTSNWNFMWKRDEP